ncbi:structure-specific endonuclease subunit SLX4 isoform X2 [Rhinatrema bivittatum]|uniref:structure-specific endonuclease subunit SLX4 isoform X2 n=1 Tax=Rhinatrema bivittatum TaxID=194408 RepID=UPI001129F7B9|nr:structure-specific endonuclease subunit SLX4 isoform X2 [Rhinatrema bivittatum]
MEESDDDFTELCAKLLRRVKRSRAEGEKKDGGRAAENGKKSSSVKGRAKNTKAVVTKGKRLNDRAKRKEQHAGSASSSREPLEPIVEGVTGDVETQLRSEQQTSAGEESARVGGTGDWNTGNPAQALPQSDDQKTQAGSQPCCPQMAPACPAAGECVSSVAANTQALPRPHTAELVLQRMQQFRRGDAKRLRHVPIESSAKLRMEGSVSQQHITNPALSVEENDEALALVLQQEVRKEIAGESLGSLEEESCCFCQICQKDLSAMNSALREQHANRCLDEDEKATSVLPSLQRPSIPECPICGKQFNAVKSRAAHLKRCATQMQVSPQLLLQAVQRQMVPPAEGLLAGDSHTSQPVGSKRKGSAKEKEPPKKKKIVQGVSEIENLLVAMVMSRSLLQQDTPELTDDIPSADLKLENGFPLQIMPGTEKKNRKKRKEVPPPPLLIQDPATALQQIQQRVALLLTEDTEAPSTPTLPASRFWEEGRGCGELWENSMLREDRPPESYYLAALIPPLSVWKPPQKENALPSVLSERPQASPQVQVSTVLALEPTHNDLAHNAEDGEAFREPRKGACNTSQSFTHSQKESQALQDLTELAKEGLTLTQWSLAAGQIHPIEGSGKRSEGSDIAPSGFVPSPRAKKRRRGSCCALPLDTLAVDFSMMVNNPHLSDVQLQMDSGDILYAHMFVLYARCPQLVQLVHSEGFLVEEDGNMRTRRVLLNDVSVEAVCAFLHYLYSASIGIPPCLRSHVAALALRFGVRELIDICENSPIEDPENYGYRSEDDLFSEEKKENCDSRAEHFQELLKSMWVDEDEEAQAVLETGQGANEEQENEKVDEQELEEIYEFSATQRKIVEDETEMEEDSEGNCICETEDHGVHKQKDEVAMVESLSAKITSEELQKNVEECLEIAMWESSRQESKLQEISACEDLHSTNANSLEGSKNFKCGNDTEPYVSVSDGKKTFERISVVNSCRSSKASRENKEKHLPPSQHSDVDLNDSYDRMFSQTWGEYLEPSQATYQMKNHGWTTTENDGKVSKSPVPDKMGQLQKDQLLHSYSCGSAAINPFMSVLPAVGLSPASPKPKITSSKVSPLMQHYPLSSSVQSKNKSTSGLLHFDEPLFQKTCEQVCTSSCGNKEIKEIPIKLASPLKPSSVELNKQGPDQRCSSSFSKGSKKPSSLMNHHEEDVILLLDSDEEMESNKNLKSVSGPLSRGRDSSPLAFTLEKTVKDPQSSEPDVSLVVGFDIDSDPLRKPGDMHNGNDLNCSLKGHCVSHIKNCTDSKLKLEQSCERDHRQEESMETSWLVPATPLTNKSQHISIQTQISNVSHLPKHSLRVKQSTEGSSVNSISRNLVKNMTINISKISSDFLLRPTSGTHVLSKSMDNKDTHPETSDKQSSGDCLPVSPVPLTPLSQCSSNIESKHLASPLSPYQGLSGLTQSVHNKSLGSSVCEIEDSEDDPEADPYALNNSCQQVYDLPIPADDCWNTDTLAPVKVSSNESVGNSHLNASNPDSNSDKCESSTRSKEMLVSTPVKSRNLGHSQASSLVYEKNSLQASLSQDSRLCFLNSTMWDHWDGEDKEFPEVLPLIQRLSSALPAEKSKELKTPVAACYKKKQIPKVPITPMPTYSDMDTPKLKKELDRFGVRRLPKRQMVLKLKEIFQYTHQILSSDSEDEIPSSQLQQQRATTVCASQLVPVPKTNSSTAVSKRKLGISSHSQPAPAKSNLEVAERPSGTGHQRLKRPPKKTTRREKAKAVSPASSPAKDRLLGTGSRQQPAASQESTTSSAAGSDESFASQSSLINDFEMAFSAGEEKEEAEEAAITASQAAIQEKDRTEALRRYIRLNPELYRKVLLYQPVELAELHAELKQNGIKISTGKLLDFLDAHCITFTTAAARKEKLQKQQSKGKRKERRRY